MNDAGLDRLRLALKTTNAQAFQGLAFEYSQLSKEVEKLKAWLGRSGTAQPSANLIREAVVRFSRVGGTASLRDVRLISYGCVEAFDGREHRLIEDAQRFPKFLDCVDGYRSAPRAFRRCYKGLLNAYFTYDPNAKWARSTGKQNWERLRSYLHARIADLQADGTLPEWV